MRNDEVIEIKKYLFNKREEILAEVDLTNKILDSKKEELREINDKICNFFGHDFSRWELRPSGDFVRSCSVCRLWEITKQIPVNYYMKVKKSKGYK